MLYALYVALMVALPAAVGAQIISRDLAQRDPTAGFVLLLFAVLQMAGLFWFTGNGLYASNRIEMGGMIAFALGAGVGLLRGIRERQRAEALA